MKDDGIVKRIAEDIGHGYISSKDIETIGVDFSNMPTDKIESFLRTLLYIRLREIDGLSKAKAYRKAFSNRISGDVSTNHLIGRARSVETTKMYKDIATTMSLGFFTSFVIERNKIINEMYEMAVDPEVGDRNRIESAKVFLENTKAPEIIENIGAFKDNSNDIQDIVESLKKTADVIRSNFNSNPNELLEILNSGKKEKVEEVIDVDVQ